MTQATQHGHGHGTEIDWAGMVAVLEREGEIRLPFLEAAAGWLAELHGSVAGQPVRRVLDVGAGPGVAAAVFAGAFPQAEVVAADGEPVLLERAAERAARLGLRVGTRRVDLAADDLTGLGTADLVWAGNVLHHLPDEGEGVRRLAALLRPGGVLAMVEGGLAPRVLPSAIGIGRPGLLARLEVASEDWFAAMRADLGGHDGVESWQAALRGAGLTAAPSRSFLVDRPAPLDRADREHVLDYLTRMRHLAGTGIADDDARRARPAARPGRPGGRPPPRRRVPAGRAHRPRRDAGLSIGIARARCRPGRVSSASARAIVVRAVRALSYHLALFIQTPHPSASAPACPGPCRPAGRAGPSRATTARP